MHCNQQSGNEDDDNPIWNLVWRRTNWALSFLTEDFWKPLGVVDACAFQSWTYMPKFLFFQGFVGPDWSFDPGHPREWSPDVRGISVTETSSLGECLSLDFGFCRWSHLCPQDCSKQCCRHALSAEPCSETNAEADVSNANANSMDKNCHPKQACSHCQASRPPSSLHAPCPIL